VAGVFDQFSDYVGDLDQQLDASANSGFQPTLDTLDALLASIGSLMRPRGNLPPCNFDSRVGHQSAQAQILGRSPPALRQSLVRESDPREFVAGDVIDLAKVRCARMMCCGGMSATSSKKLPAGFPKARGEDVWLEPVKVTGDSRTRKTRTPARFGV